MLVGASKSISSFDPRSIPGCSLWLDGADTATMNSTPTVTTWTDKSGQGNNVTGTATYSSGTMTFNGSTQAFSNTAYVFPSNAYSMFAVYSNTTAPGATSYMNVVYGNGGYPMLGVYGSSKFVSARSVVANTGALSPNIVASNVLVGATYTPSTFSPFINGSAETTLAGTTLAATGIYVGGPTNYFNGSVSEILIYSATLTQTQRQTVEGYLAWKWGINPSLPAIHPFYSLPAFSRPFGPLDIPGCALWLDATDSSTITLSGSSVIAWKDKSSNALTFSTVGTSSFLTVTSNINGRQTLYFNNIAADNVGILGTVTQTSTVNVFVVWQHLTQRSGSYRNIVGWQMSTLTYPGALNFGYPFNPNNAVGFWDTANGAPTSTQAVTVSSNYLGFFSLSGPTLGLNGATPTSYSASYSSNWTTLYIGGTPAYGQTVSMYLGEVVIFSNTLTTNQRQSVEGYLAAKWGLLSSVVSGHPFKSIPPSTSQPPQFQEVTPGNWKYDWQPYLSNLAAANSSGLTITTANITGGATYSGGWWGGVLAPNGNIYFCPVGATNILVLNPTTGVTSNLTGGATYTGGWSGGVLAPNGNIYFAPLNAPNVLVLNPTTGVTSNLTGGATYTTGGWSGGVLAPNGNIYFTPYQSTNTLVLNPTTGVTSNLTGGGTYNASYGYFGSVLAPNGNIYFCPLNSSSILFLNPNTGVTSNITGGATYTLGNAWIGGVLHPNGKIYFTPYSATNILVLDPATGVTSNLTGGATFTGNQGWSGGVLGPDGNIYFTPYQATNILVLNPTTGVTSNLTGGGTYNATGWFGGGTLAPNGNVYFSPTSATNIMRLNFAGLSQLPSSNYCLSAWTNKR